MKYTIFSESAFDRFGCGVIGISPHVPAPPAITFSERGEIFACVNSYFAATSLYDGPTILFSIVWHVLQSLELISASPCAIKSFTELDAASCEPASDAGASDAGASESSSPAISYSLYASSSAFFSSCLDPHE